MELKRLTGKKEKFYAALLETMNNVSAAERKCGIDRTTHYSWIRKDPIYKEWIERLPEVQVDFYEQALHKLISSGNPAASIFALKTKGKHRGWVEKSEISHTGIAPVNFIIQSHNDTDKETDDSD